MRQAQVMQQESLSLCCSCTCALQGGGGLCLDHHLSGLGTSAVLLLSWGTRKPVERSQTWTGHQVFVTLIFKAGIAPCSSGPLSLRGGTMLCLAIIANCETQPAWGPQLRMPLLPPMFCTGSGCH